VVNLRSQPDFKGLYEKVVQMLLRMQKRVCYHGGQRQWTTGTHPASNFTRNWNVGSCWPDACSGAASVTSEPAKYSGRRIVGTVQAGKVADLVLLDADPLTDIRNTAKSTLSNGREAFRKSEAKRTEKSAATHR